MPELFTDEIGLPLTTRREIPYEIETLSYKEQWVEGANQTTIICRVKETDAGDWVTDMVGQVYVAGSTTRYLRRHLPEANPYYPNQWCTRVEQVDQGGDPYEPGGRLAGQTPGGWGDPDANHWPLTKWLRYRATFQGMPFKLLTDQEVDDLEVDGDEPELCRYVERRRTVIARELGFPGGGFKIIGTNDKLQQTGFRVIPHADVEYRLHRVPVDELPLNLLQRLVGKINRYSFDVGLGGYFFLSEELLYTGFDDNQKMWDPDDTWCCMPLILRFRWRLSGWNKFLNNEARLVGVSLDGSVSGVKPYDTTDQFNELFRVKPP